MSIILGLDVSTSCIGVCVLDSNFYENVWQTKIILLEAIEFPKCKTMWCKADRTFACLTSIAHQSNVPPIDRVVLEEPLMGFRPGMSSAQTISTLMRFNGIVSYMARNIFNHEPEYIGSAHARKLCNIKLQRTAIGGPQKEQVFAHMAANDLKDIQWPLKKSGKTVDWSRDACDAYVIARAAAVNGPVQPPAKKPRKSKKANEE